MFRSLAVNLFLAHLKDAPRTTTDYGNTTSPLPIFCVCLFFRFLMQPLITPPISSLHFPSLPRLVLHNSLVSRLH